MYCHIAWTCLQLVATLHYILLRPLNFSIAIADFKYEASVSVHILKQTFLSLGYICADFFSWFLFLSTVPLKMSKAPYSTPEWPWKHLPFYKLSGPPARMKASSANHDNSIYNCTSKLHSHVWRQWKSTRRCFFYVHRPAQHHYKLRTHS